MKLATSLSRRHFLEILGATAAPLGIGLSCARPRAASPQPSSAPELPAFPLPPDLAAEQAPEPQPPLSPRPRPSILWISCENLSRRLGCYGDRVARTPNLDRLASESTRYTHVFASNAGGSAVRSALVTGMYPTSIGTHHTGSRTGAAGLPPTYSPVPPPYVKAFTEYLRAAGYYCACRGRGDDPFDAPRTAWDACGPEAHYRHRPDPQQPFFASFDLGHIGDGRDAAGAQQIAAGQGNAATGSVRTDPAMVTVPPYYPDTPPVRQEIARLYDDIASLDAQVGLILAELAATGLAASTVVCFFSTRGDDLPRSEGCLYDSGTHVPLIVRWPDGLYPGKTDDRLVSSVDLGPTALSIADVDVPAHVQGQALLGRQAAAPRSHVFSARDRVDDRLDLVRSVRGSRYLYIRNAYPNTPYLQGVPQRDLSPTMQELLRVQAERNASRDVSKWLSHPRPAEELYDCELDPHQTENFAAEPRFAAVLTDLRRVLDEWQRDTSDLGGIAEVELQRRGWPEGTEPVTAAPLFVTNHAGGRNHRPGSGKEWLKPPATVSLYCPTEGASIAYALGSSPDGPWHLYTGPVSLLTGETRLRARAIRYGFKESPEAAVLLSVR